MKCFDIFSQTTKPPAPKVSSKQNETMMSIAFESSASPVATVTAPVVRALVDKEIVPLDETRNYMSHHDVLRLAFEKKAAFRTKQLLTATDIVFTHRVLEMSKRFRKSKQGADRVSRMVRMLVYLDDHLDDLLAHNLPLYFKMALNVHTMTTHVILDLEHSTKFQNVEERHKQMLRACCEKVNATICKHAFA